MQKIIRTGHSAALTIPAKFFKDLNLRIGDHAETISDYLEGSLTYKFQEVRQLRLGTPTASSGTKTAAGKKVKK